MTRYKSPVRAACQSFGGAVCAGAVLLIAASAQAQNLFEADFGSGKIYEFTSNGGSTTFASGLNEPTALAFQGVTLPVPEPSTWSMLEMGFVVLLVSLQRHRRSS
jgi:hypothetical protein